MAHGNAESDGEIGFTAGYVGSSRFENNRATGNFTGFAFTRYSVFDTIVRNQATRNTGAGFEFTGQMEFVDGNTSNANGTYGFANRWDGFRIAKPPDPADASPPDRLVFTHNIANNNGAGATATGGGYGFEVAALMNSTFSGNLANRNARIALPCSSGRLPTLSTRTRAMRTNP